MANVASNRSPSPLPSRNCRNSETNSTTRRSFNGNPFGRPTAVVNPKNVNPPSPANSTAVTQDHLKRNSIGRSSMFKDEKENHIKDVIRSPAKGCSKNFMAPTISAASKFTPSPRKKVLGEKNDLSRSSIQFVDKDFDLKPESTVFNQATRTEEGSQEPITLDQKEEVLETTTPVHEVTFSSITDANETSSDLTENSDFVKIMPFCCSPLTSPIVAPLHTNTSLPPYDPKKNFLSPRPQFLRYKPNPRIEILLNKENGNDGYGDEDVTRLDDSFNLSDISSDTDEKENEEKQYEFGSLVHGSSEVSSEEKQSELGDLFHGSSEDSSEIVSEEKQSGCMVVKSSKYPFFTRSKTISFLLVMFLVACFSVSFTDSPPMDLPIYKDVSFSEIYHESLKFAAIDKECFDDLVENFKQWSINLVSYLSDQISHLGCSTHGSIQFYNLTTSPIQEEFIFNRHIGTDYADVKLPELIQEFEEEMEDEAEIFEEVDDEVDVADEIVTEETNRIQPDEVIQGDDDGLLETKLNLEDGSSVIASSSESQSASEMAMNDPEIEIESSSADSSVEVSSETLTSLLNNKSINTICLAGFSMVIMAISAIFYMIKRKSNATKTAVHVVDDDMSRESSSSGSSIAQKRYKKKTVNDKRESLASSSSSDFSRASASYGSFTTFERIPIKHGDEVMLTPIRRSSRLLKNQVTSS